MMATTRKTESNIAWPTKAEAAKALNVSTKTVEKWVAGGRLRQQMQPQVNKPARAVIDPATIEALIAEREGMKQVELHRPEGRLERPPAEIVQKLQEWINVPRVNWPVPIYLTAKEAAMYTGLSEGYIRRMHKEEKLAALTGMRGLRFRRTDLDAL